MMEEFPVTNYPAYQYAMDYILNLLSTVAYPVAIVICAMIAKKAIKMFKDK